MAMIDQSKFGRRERRKAGDHGISPELGLRDLVFDYVCEVADLTRDELLNSDRMRHAVEARTLFVAIIRHVRPGITYETIGLWLGGRTRPGVRDMHMSAIAARMKDPRFADYFSGFMALYRLTGEIPYACE